MKHLNRNSALLKNQSGINMVDLMMWLVIAALLLAAAIQGTSYYREASILHQLKNDAMGAASNVSATAASNDGNIDQPVVDNGLNNTEWSTGTLSTGTATSTSGYSITTSNSDIDKSVVYCSSDGLTVVPNSELSSFKCGDTAVASGDYIDTISGGSSGTGGSGTGEQAPAGTLLAGWGYSEVGQLANGPIKTVTTPGPFEGKSLSMLTTTLDPDSQGMCGLADGTMYCWGLGPDFRPQNMQENGVLAGKTITDITITSALSCVIADGQAYCWKWNINGSRGDGGPENVYTTDPVAVSTSGVLAGKTLKYIDTNGYTTCAVDTQSKVYCWGYNNVGQLGNGTITNSNVPVAVNMSGALNGVSIAKIDMASNGACVMSTDGKAFCWGHAAVTATWGTGTNSPGSTKNYEWNPVRVANNGLLSGKTITDISSGAGGVCVISDGSQYCWGDPAYATTPYTVANNAPRLIGGLPSGVTVKTLDGYCALASNAKAYCFNSDGTGYVPFVGTTTSPFSDQPITEVTNTCIVTEGQVYCSDLQNTGLYPASHSVTENIRGTASPDNLSSFGYFAGKNITKIGGGDYGTCAVMDTELYCWGDNSDGQMGIGTTGDNQLTPVKVSGLSGEVTNFSVGYSHSCAVANDTAYCWGRNSSGQLGNGSTDASYVPVPVGGELASKKVSKVVVADSATCALTAGSEVYCWGENGWGMLGNGTYDSSLVPVKIEGSSFAGKTVTDISSNNYNFCTLADGTPYCWGGNWEDNIDGSGADDVNVPRALDMSGMGGKTFKTVTVGESHFCGLASDDYAYCWGGYNIGNGTSTASYVPVKIELGGTVTTVGSGSYHSCALVSGSVSCWGMGNVGQMGDGEFLDRLSPVRVGGFLSDKSVKTLSVTGYSNFAIYN